MELFTTSSSSSSTTATTRGERERERERGEELHPHHPLHHHQQHPQQQQQQHERPSLLLLHGCSLLQLDPGGGGKKPHPSSSSSSRTLTMARRFASDPGPHYRIALPDDSGDHHPCSTVPATPTAPPPNQSTMSPFTICRGGGGGRKLEFPPRTPTSPPIWNSSMNSNSSSSSGSSRRMDLQMVSTPHTPTSPPAFGSLGPWHSRVLADAFPHSHSSLPLQDVNAATMEREMQIFQGSSSFHSCDSLRLPYNELSRPASVSPKEHLLFSFDEQKANPSGSGQMNDETANLLNLALMKMLDSEMNAGNISGRSVQIEASRAQNTFGNLSPGSIAKLWEDAIASEDTQKVSSLLNQGFNPNGERQYMKAAPLILAVMSSSEKIVKLLLTAGADINLCDNRKRTALHYASSTGNRNLVKLLLVAGANPYAKTEEGLFPMQLATDSQTHQLLSLKMKNDMEGRFHVQQPKSPLSMLASEKISSMDRELPTFMPTSATGSLVAVQLQPSSKTGSKNKGQQESLCNEYIIPKAAEVKKGESQVISREKIVEPQKQRDNNAASIGSSQSFDQKKNFQGSKNPDISIKVNNERVQVTKNSEVPQIGDRNGLRRSKSTEMELSNQSEKSTLNTPNPESKDWMKEKKQVKFVPPLEEDLALIRKDWHNAAKSGCIGCGKEECNGKCIPLGSYQKGKERSIGKEDKPTEKKSISKVEKKRPLVFEWRKGELLGEGAYGKVYAGLNQSTGELMAVKQLKLNEPLDAQERAAYMSSLEREINLYKTMRHKHIVGYIDMDHDEASGSIYIFLEYISGGSIQSMLERFGRFSEELVKNYTRQLLLGLEYLHANRIVHRDIKGGNVLVDSDGIVKLGDFGASKAFHDPTITDGCKSIRGSIFWMAPEVIKGDGYGRRADIWSVGCTVIEMLTAMHPWPTIDNTWAAIFHIAKASEGPPIPKEASEGAKEFLRECFKLNPRMRPSAVELLQHPYVTSVSEPSV